MTTLADIVQYLKEELPPTEGDVWPLSVDPTDSRDVIEVLKNEDGVTLRVKETDGSVSAWRVTVAFENPVLEPAAVAAVA
jgi:hypothetical protein